MPDEIGRRSDSWKALDAVAALAAPLFAVLWLGVTLTSDPSGFAITVVKIVFAIVVVGTGILGIRWMTASGITLLIEALVAVAWVIVRFDAYPPFGALKTLLLLAAPIAVSGVLFVLAGGIRAGTWPPGRFWGRS